jgi:hypothetical protein
VTHRNGKPLRGEPEEFIKSNYSLKRQFYSHSSINVAGPLKKELFEAILRVVDE